MRSFAIAALVGSATAVQFGANDVPTCKVVNGHTVVSYTANIHPSFKCSHTSGSCKCTVHPTHAQGKCREFDHSDGANHKVSGDCTASGVNAINGGYSGWNYGACSKTCGGGTRQLSRTCTNPAPNVNGAACVGAATTSQSCNTQACPTSLVAPVNHHIKYNGYCYTTMDKCDVNLRYGACGATCQNGYLAMPAGYSLVPYSNDLVQNVVKAGHFSTHVVVFSNGHGYGGRSYNNGVLWNKNMLTSSGKYHKTRSCSLKVLMRAAC